MAALHIFHSCSYCLFLRIRQQSAWTIPEQQSETHSCKTPAVARQRLGVKTHNRTADLANSRIVKQCFHFVLYFDSFILFLIVLCPHTVVGARTNWLPNLISTKMNYGQMQQKAVTTHLNARPACKLQRCDGIVADLFCLPLGAEI